MWLSGFERQTQRLAWAEQMLLADHLVRCLRAELFGKRHLQAFIDSGGKKVFGHRESLLAAASHWKAIIVTGIKPMRGAGNTASEIVARLPFAHKEDGKSLISAFVINFSPARSFAIRQVRCPCST